MVRVQVQFTEEQLKGLREQAHGRGLSVAEVVRRMVSRGLETQADDLAHRYERAWAMVGAYHEADGVTDLAENHDAYLAEAP